MKSYIEIPGPSKAPNGSCIAFVKYDGSNLRFLWSKKHRKNENLGWIRQGTRNCLFDTNDLQWGASFSLFMKLHAEKIAKILIDHKDYRGVEEAVVFCEYFGKDSFAGWHDYEALNRGEAELKLFDVNIHKKGFVTPRDFVRNFEYENVAEVVYEGNFGVQFIEDVKSGKYPVIEGVVAKGIFSHGKPPHNIWMAKVKTKSWIEKLKAKSIESEEFGKILKDNSLEQQT